MNISTFCATLQKIIPNLSVEVRADSRLVDDLCICSFDMMVIIEEIERTFNTSMRFDRLVSVETVQDLFDIFFEGGDENG